MVRVRFAPSPTGFLHIGGLRTALYNELFALRNGGTFFLRIEDTDRTRYVEGAVESLLRTLERAGIHPAEGPYLDGDTVKERGDYGPYVQSARTAIYADHAEKLLASGNAYRCFCTPERLEEMKKGQTASKQAVMYDRKCRTLAKADADRMRADGVPSVVRLAVPQEGSTVFVDAIRGEIGFENALIDDQVLLKSDGFPTYHLANVVDDHLMKVTHVIRGEEWLPSTPKHLLLYAAFGWDAPTFAHLPLLLNPDRSKLSKRQGDVAAEDYLDKGYVPEAIVNFIALLGWNPSGEREIYGKEDLAKEFSLEKVNKAGAVFNREKLDWLNKEYLKAMTAAELARRALPFYENADILKAGEGDEVRVCGSDVAHPMSYLERVVSLEQRRVTTLAELPEATAYFFADRVALDVAMLPGKKGTRDTALECLRGLREFLAALDAAAFEAVETIEKAVVAHVAEKGWTNATALWPLRVALTGRAASPSPFEVAWVLGKERSLSRVDAAITALA